MDEPSKFIGATLEDIIADPNKFGAPTFTEFRKNPDKYKIKRDQWLAACENGSSMLPMVKKHIYKVNGTRAESAEHAERMASDMGFDIHKMIPRPNIIDLGGGWCNMEINFVPKDDTLGGGANEEKSYS